MFLFFKQLSILGIVVGGLYVFGLTLNHLVPWIWLTYFFALLRVVVRPLNFLWDIDQTFIVFGVALSLLVSVWILKGVFIIRGFFINSSQ